MKASDTTRTKEMKLPPEPPIWLGASLAAILGALFIGAIIALHYLLH